MICKITQDRTEPLIPERVQNLQASWSRRHAIRRVVLGHGVTFVELAKNLNLSSVRIAQLYHKAEREARCGALCPVEAWAMSGEPGIGQLAVRAKFSVMRCVSCDEVFSRLMARSAIFCNECSACVKTTEAHSGNIRTTNPGMDEQDGL